MTRIYLALAGGAFCLMLGLFWLWRSAEGEADREREARVAAEIAAASARAVVAELEQDALDLQIRLDAANARYAALAQATATRRQDVRDLAAEDENVASYLDQPVPADLCRVFTDEPGACGGAGQEAASGGPPDPVRGAGSTSPGQD